jgi:hypothetical protein
VTFDPLPPVLFATPAQLEQWTASIRGSFSPGVPIDAPEHAPEDWADVLTPACFNALRGLDMANPKDVATASAILAVWRGYLSRAGLLRAIPFSFDDGESGSFMDLAAPMNGRLLAIESFAMWWRALSSDPGRFDAFRREAAP